MVNSAGDTLHTGKIPIDNLLTWTVMPKKTLKKPDAIPSEKRSRGRPKGSENKTTTALKVAAVLAAEAAGEKLAFEKPEIAQNSRPVTYLTHLALEHPASFLALLGKVMMVQQRDEVRGASNADRPREIIIEIGYVDPKPTTISNVP